ncbi:MAG: HyaD/HybD family hydrogenase maturation endopeptidase [Coriobacteriia bacterium]|nr:HyaD/HybD family hydrogenase maturation endopeptidase [Coriobacteriia bacterium]
MSNERVMVMGIGNPLMRDEGIGVRVIETMMSTLAFPDNVELVDAGTMGMGILNLFQQCDYMLIVDAVDGTGEAPGTVVRFTPEDIAPNQVRHSMHDTRFIDVLQAAELMGHRPEADCIGVQIKEMDVVDIGLTPELEASVPAAVEAVLAVLAERGITAEPRADASVDARVLEAIRTYSTGPGREG